MAPAAIAIADVYEASTGITLSLGRDRLAEGAGTAAMTVIATVDKGAPTSAVTVTLALSGTATGGGTDYTAVSATLPTIITIAADQVSGVETFDLELTDDSIDEGDETIIVSGTAVGLDGSGASITIIDDDTASGVELTASPASIDEDVEAPTTVTLTATLSGGITRTVDTVVSIDKTLRGTARPPGDYSVGANWPPSVTIAAGESTGMATVSFLPTRLGGGDGEGDETIIVSGTAAGLDVSDATIVIKEAGVPTVTLEATGSPTEGKTVAVEVTATRTGSTGRLSVPLAITGGTATAGVDFAALRLPTITIADGDTSGTATVTIAAEGTYDDKLIETGGETVLIGVAPGRVRAANPASFTLADNDTASTMITLELDVPKVVAENTGPALVTATATVDNGAPTEDVIVTLTLGGSATRGVDYTDPGQITLTIGAGELSGTESFILHMTDDSIDEGDETITVSGSACRTRFDPCPTGDQFAVSSAGLTVTDDDKDKASGVISLAFSPARIAEDSSDAVTLTVTATLSGTISHGTDTTVTLDTALDGGATGGGTDYTLGESLPASVTILAGELSGNSSFGLTMTDDSIDEGDETITLGGLACRITPAPSQPCPDGSSFTVNPAVTIVTDDDAQIITLSVSRSVTEGTSGPVTVTATRSLIPGGPAANPAIRVPLAFRGGTATAGKDYVATSRQPTIVIKSGSRSGTLRVTSSYLSIVDDPVIEPDETIGIDVATAVSRSTVVPAVITIVDDDIASQKVTLQARRFGNLVSVTAQLDGAAPREAVTVTLSLTGVGTAAVVDPPEPIVIPIGQVSATTGFVVDPAAGTGKITVAGAATGSLRVPDTTTVTVSRSVPPSSGTPGGGGSAGGEDRFDCGSLDTRAPFVDVPETLTAASAIACIYALGVTAGTSPTTYSPADNVTRGQMASILARLYKAVTGADAAVKVTPFTDVDTTLAAYDDIGRIYGLGVTAGTSPTTYSPADNVTRGQMASFLARLYKAVTAAPDPA